MTAKGGLEGRGREVDDVAIVKGELVLLWLRGRPFAAVLSGNKTVLSC